MQNGKPLVSILMTAFNRAEFLGTAIQSVLDSSYTNFELIIVDDCSTDNTLEIAESYKLKDNRISVYKNTNNIGDYPNRNQAASYAKGKYIKYCDSDDFLYPHAIEVMVNAIEKFNDAGFGLSSQGEPYSSYPVCISSRQAYIEHFNGYGHFDRAPGSAIIKKSAFDDVGGFSGKRMIGDFEFWFIIARKYPMVKFQRDLYWDRIHSGQESKSRYSKNYQKLKKEIIDSMLGHVDCPLTQNEIKLIKKKLKITLIKKTLLALINCVSST